MTPYLAYVLGALTIIVIWLLFYLGATFNANVNSFYSELICPLPPT